MKLSQAEIAARLAQVRRDYIASLQEKRDSISANWRALCMQWDPEHYASLYLILHSLAGSAETFGLSGLTGSARVLVNDFKQHIDEKTVSPITFQGLQDDFESLMSEIEKALAENDRHW